jgi:hypothetical protein
MPRPDIHASRTHGVSELYIRRVIPNREGLCQVDAMLGGGLVEKMRIRLDAGTAIGSLVWADVDVRDRNTMLSEIREDPGIYLIHALHGDETPGHTGLIRDEEEKEPLLQPEKRIHGLGIEHNLRRLAQMPPIFDQRPIPVQKHRGTESSNLRHSTPNTPAQPAIKTCPTLSARILTALAPRAKMRRVFRWRTCGGFDRQGRLLDGGIGAVYNAAGTWQAQIKG